MKQLKIISFLCVIFLSGCSYLFAATAQTSCQKASNTCKVSAENIYFTYQKASNSDAMLITLSAKTTGWVAVGFGATDDMRDANIIMGYINKDNQPVISNEYGVGKWSHKSMASLNAPTEVQLISGKYENGWTTIQFTIPLESKDKKYGKVFKTGSNISVILAYGPNGKKNFTSYHQFRAKGEITDFKL
ncbi:DOMON domain-containing protein [Thiotrichales bacterium 19S3-7]|nr:DOMON domain-containing protein [Thiotrichales bacterium 19S3-7]MCF6801452.1 DOMON domain-containing protein [Thiotrichales bacterium 19S3-11]